MKRIFIIVLAMFMLLPISNINFVVAEQTENVYVVVANRASIFEFPDFNSTQLGVLNHKDEVVLEFENGLPKQYSLQSFFFYKVLESKQNIEGYVFADLVVPKSTMPTAIPKYNAKTNNACILFFKEDNNFAQSTIALKKDTQIFLYEGFNNKLEYTAVSFVHENEVLYGYIKTEFVSPNGVNPAIIYSLIVIMALLGIIFAWIFMKKKKVGKIKKKTIIEK